MTGRILALDVGQKRIGVALSDPNRIIASGQPTLAARPLPQAYQRICQIVQDEEVTQIVIGLPLTLRGEVGPQAQIVKQFAAELGKLTDVPIELYDERMTSIAAERSLQAMGMKRDKRRDHVDQLAAILILQAYMDAQRIATSRASDESDAD